MDNLLTKFSPQNYIPEIIVPGKAPQNTLIAVAMSGGVDSSAVAALLKANGYNVIGITLQLYDNTDAAKGKTCCSIDDVYDAKRVACKIGIPHYVLNYEEIFQEKVLKYFLDSYTRGHTPIPCIKCNETVKFDNMLTFAHNLGCDALATGHYIKRKIDDQGRVSIHTAKDPAKDQSYFLFSLTPWQIRMLRFPLGDLLKTETRELAEYYKLNTAKKRDSQGLCFVTSGKYTNIINKLAPSANREGNIIDKQGTILGKHSGIAAYTVGQRKGLGISNAEPLYVTAINAQNNTITVGKITELTRQKVYTGVISWIDQSYVSTKTARVQIKIRALSNKTEATMHIQKDGSACFELSEPQRGITSGQACVIYNQTQLLGGAWIQDEPQIASQ